jgi:Protein of unknown function (DUF1549)/Protein of unknown function (DUF1553)
MSVRLAALALFVLASPVLALDDSRLLPADLPIEQVIDHYLDAALQEAKIQPASQADDWTLIRRLTLDLNGRIPTVAEATNYVADQDTDKKNQLVERLIASPAFVRQQAQEFFAFLNATDDARKAGKKNGLHEYLVNAFKENRGWDNMFRDMMLADESDPATRGAGEFLKSRVKDQNKMTIDTSIVFFGVNVSCAQCHNHPHVPAWTQDHFYGMKNFFARTVEAGTFLAEKDFGLVKYLPNKGKEKVAPVMFLTGKTMEVPGFKEPSKEEKKQEQARIDESKKAKKAPAPPQFSMRAKLVETVLEPGQNDFFARAIVNRLWHRFYGRGLVMPLDQMHIENPASHPELLQWLARDFVASKYDLRRLTRGLVLSKAYARVSRWDGDKMPPEDLFAVAQVRPLGPTQMATSLKLAALDSGALPSDKEELEKRLAQVEKSAENLAAFFPQPGDNFQVGAGEALLFTNNQTLAKELLEGKASLAARLKNEPDFAARADSAVRTILGRPARPDEIQTLTDYMKRRADRELAACQQIVWALMTSAEFRFNH